MLCEIVTALEQHNIPYTLGGCTLVGAADGNSEKHSPHPTLYLFKLSALQFVKLFFTLLPHKILLKPKAHYLKLKRKTQRAFLFPLKESAEGYTAVVKNETIFFSCKDLSPNHLEVLKEKSSAYMVPQNTKRFVEKYKREILSNYYQPFEVQLTDESEQKAVALLKGVSATVKKAGLQAWIEGGTLLGAIRDKRLIPWDHDIDMGIIFSDNEAISYLVKALRREYSVKICFFNNSPSGIWNLGKYRLLKIYPKRHLFFREKICCDLFIYYPAKDEKTGEKIYRYVVWDQNAAHKAKHFDKLDSIDFYGVPVITPAYPEEFLATKYGENWRIPQKTWNVALDDGSVVSRE